MQQGESVGHQFENYRPVFDLSPEARDAGGKNAAVIGKHRSAEIDPRLTLGFFDQSGLIEQFVALKCQFLVPAAAIKAEGEVGA
ncbi:hypothetical protein D3C87_1520040 [compost metagenome]